MRVRCVWLFLTLLASACDRGEEAAPPDASPVQDELARVTFDTASALVITDSDTLRLRVELAVTEDQKRFGLMDRDSLAGDAGMVFLYDAPQPATSSFYMYRTRIPLDIAFFDSSGRIVSIVGMSPCTTPVAQQCPTYPAGASYIGALEVNRGWAQMHGVDVGDRVVVPGRVGG